MSVDHHALLPAFAAVALFTFTASADAQPADPLATPSVYLQTAVATHGTDALTLGATVPWSSWESTLWGSQVRGYWDISVSRWTADGPGGRFHTNLLGVTPSFRLVPDAGRSRWFYDVGVGATLASRRYVTLYKAFSTRFNFASHLGVGLALGAQRQHELQLRLEHVSNAGLKEPNPGENLVQLRYALHF